MRELHQLALIFRAQLAYGLLTRADGLGVRSTNYEPQQAHLVRGFVILSVFPKASAKCFVEVRLVGMIAKV